MINQKRFEVYLRAQLLPGESSLSIAELRVPKRFTSATSFFPVVTIVRLVDEVRNRIKLQELRGKLSTIPVPVARRMVVCVTERRILIWKRSTWYSKGRFLGSVEGQRVRAAQLERSTHVNWNVITLQILDDLHIRLLIDQPTAQQFAKAVNANTDDQKIDSDITPT